MTTTSDEDQLMDSISDILSARHAARTDLSSFAEYEQASKPLVAFDEPPMTTAPPLRWVSKES
jgi:hypothetical protein